jgi:cytoskeletal protein RodZ
VSQVCPNASNASQLSHLQKGKTSKDKMKREKDKEPPTYFNTHHGSITPDVPDHTHPLPPPTYPEIKVPRQPETDRRMTRQSNELARPVTRESRKSVVVSDPIRLLHTHTHTLGTNILPSRFDYLLLPVFPFNTSHARLRPLVGPRCLGTRASWLVGWVG